VAKKEAPKPVAKVAAKPAAPVAKAPAGKAGVKTPVKGMPVTKHLPLKAAPAPTPRPTATPAARSLEKKPTVIIAHRRLENKSKSKEETPAPGYQADTYRSILDEPAQLHQTVYRYSDEDLAEFKEIIASRLDLARKEMLYLQGLITRKDEAGTEDTENRYMNMEDGSGAMEREQLAQLASRQIQFINHLEKALVRIENKTYGICRVTGKLIDKARLRAVPHATLSIEAKKTMSSRQG
jgi:RNA polymerase-binding transcription factor DksA